MSTQKSYARNGAFRFRNVDVIVPPEDKTRPTVRSTCQELCVFLFINIPLQYCRLAVWHSRVRMVLHYPVLHGLWTQSGSGSGGGSGGGSGVLTSVSSCLSFFLARVEFSTPCSGRLSTNFYFLALSALLLLTLDEEVYVLDDRVHSTASINVGVGVGIRNLNFHLQKST